MQRALSAIVVSSTICYRKQWQLFYLEGNKKISHANKAYFILVVKTKCDLYCFKPDKEALWVTTASATTTSATRKTNFLNSHGSTGSVKYRENALIIIDKWSPSICTAITLGSYFRFSPHWVNLYSLSPQEDS